MAITCAIREVIRGARGGDYLGILPERPKAHVHAAHRTPERQELFKGAEMRAATPSEDEERAQCVAGLLEEELMRGQSEVISVAGLLEEELMRGAIRGHQRQSEEELMRGAIRSDQGQCQGHYLPPLSRGNLGDLRGVLCEDRVEEGRLELELRAHGLCEHE